MRDRITLDVGRAETRIDRNIYGHFAEHLGRCIYGGFWVGPDSPIPNTRGIRDDVVSALRRIRVPVLRWPGGCFADEYHWMDGIGPRESRPSMVNTHWGGVVENNHFGTHEYMDLCEQLGCAPYICGNVGSGTVQEMSGWLEYLGFGGRSPLADRRRDNGREPPWKIRFWGVGNESWGCGGRMTAEYYSDLLRRYGLYCRSYGEEPLFKIACGPRNDDYRWTEVLMARAGQVDPLGGGRDMDGLSLHYYTQLRRLPGGQREGPATGFNESAWIEILDKALFMQELVRRHGEIMDRYDPGREVALIVDEWGTWYASEPGTNPRFLYQQNTMRDALVAGLTLDIFNRHCDRVRMANIAQTVNVLQALVLTDGAGMLLTPTYHVFEMYAVHQDALLVPCDIATRRYQHGERSIPALAGSASVDSSGRMHLSLCNTDPHTDIPVTVEVQGRRCRRAGGRVLRGAAMDACNTFEAPDAVQSRALAGVEVRPEGFSFTAPRMSVLVLEAS
jgi:alpha-N-arabinofuranosidase